MSYASKYIRARYKRRSEHLDFAAVCVQDLAPASLSSIVAHKREAQSLVQALREIPIEDQVVLELMYFEGLSGSELAGVLGLPEGTVRGRLARGKQRLRERVAALLARAPARPGRSSRRPRRRRPRPAGSARSARSARPLGARAAARPGLA
jgi:RNA polymerase sigma-70 factor (ECF subfamily)